ncbi:ABC transporter permease [Methylosinus sp. R-45379]|jgi:phospholipid/cholesterol/gamma-HCH transport system permease protein|uniref:MlaE family ABC transporter permease n=1 Tax=unclassified Methylosinus TaxID=2624500 RepID=UPI0004658BE0|nr:MULTISPECIES: ABC transporter permease [unclassified Methylosinus]OAI23211.1 ABC transporter permease [Methylosinus sp. R-45379]TDX65783.1 phospholipid/cholesterol/gamma-HCH transport system permease protein [Methylosinus sp. sav-2]
MATDLDHTARLSSRREGETARFALGGEWVLADSAALEKDAAGMAAAARGAARAIVDLAQIVRLDTAGAWIIGRAMDELAHAGVSVSLEGARPEHVILLQETKFRPFEAPSRCRRLLVVDILADLGRSVVSAAQDAYSGVGFLGEFVVASGVSLMAAGRFRFTSLVYHMESFGFRSLPIIALINLLVGAIVAQQGIFQLRRFGAGAYAVDLIGILVLRELGVLLTSIMIAGRSGSAITAELGSMKMREEVDALRVMGLSPVEVLVTPRVLALVLSLPLLTFIADMSALFGGLLVCWVYEGISPAAYLSLLQAAIGRNTFIVGLIKAPFMALVIGMVAAMEGMATRGSAESLGRHVTASVVKAIFMVIVLDGFFAIFFAAIKY